MAIMRLNIYQKQGQKILSRVKILVKLIDEKIDKKNILYLSAGIFNPYLKKGIFEKHAEFERHLLEQLESSEMVDYYTDSSFNTPVETLPAKDNLTYDSEDEGQGEFKKLKFDEDFEFSQEKQDAESPGNELKRYKNARLSKNDIAVLFDGKVISFNSRRKIMAALAKYYLSIPASSVFLG